MATLIGSLYYKITGDTAALDDSLDASREKVERLGRSAGSLGAKLRKGLGGAVILKAGKDLVEAASRAEELRNKFDTVFAGMERSADAWAREYAGATSRGVTATKEFLATQQDLRTGFGDTAEGAARFSQAVVGVTNDLASFSNIPVAETMQAINSGLAGQFEALRRLGVGLNVQIINQGAYAQALGKTWEQMGNLERQEAVLSGIVSQSKNAIHQQIQTWREYDYTIGDAAATSKSFANSSQGLLQTWEDTKAALGESLIPAVNGLANGLLGLLRAYNALPGPIHAVTTATLALAAAKTVLEGPLGWVVGGLSALAVLLSRTDDEADALAASTKELQAALADYKSAADQSATSTGDLAESSKALAKVQQDLAKAKAAGALADMLLGYERLQEELRQLQILEAESKASVKAWTLYINEGDEAVNRRLAQLKGLGAAVTEEQTIELEALDAVSRKWFKSPERAADALKSASDDMSEYIGLITEKNGMLEAAMGTLSASAKLGLLDISNLAAAYPELAAAIAAAGAGAEEAAGALGGLSDATAGATALGGEWAAALKAQQADALEAAGRWAEAAALRKELLAEELEAERRALAAKAGVAKEGQELTDEALEAARESNASFRAEEAALAAYYGGLMAAEDAKAAGAAEKAAAKAAKARADSSKAWTDMLADQSRAAREAEALEAESAGDHERAYGLRIAMLSEERAARKAALEAMIADGKASGEDMLKLDDYYGNEEARLVREKAAAVARAGEEAAERRAESLRTWQDRLAEQSRQAVEAWAAETQAGGGFRAAMDARLALLDEEMCAETAAARGKGALEEELAAIVEFYENKKARVRADSRKAELAAMEEEAERAKRIWLDAAGRTLGAAGQIADGIAALQKARTDAAIEQIDKETAARLAAEGLGEKSRTETLEREREAAVEAGDMELAAEKERELRKAEILDEADRRKKAAQRDQAKREREMAIFGAYLSMFKAIIGAMGDPGGWAGVAMSALAATTGGLQIAAIKSQPLPSFRVGAEEIPRDMLAVVHQGESILPRPMAESVRRGEAVYGKTPALTLQVVVHNHSAERVEAVGSEEGGEPRLDIVIGRAVEAQIGQGRYDRAMMGRYGVRRIGRNA